MRAIPLCHCIDGVFFHSSAMWYTHSGTLSYSTLYRNDMPTWRGEPFLTVAICGAQWFWSTIVSGPTDSHWLGACTKWYLKQWDAIEVRTRMHNIVGNMSSIYNFGYNYLSMFDFQLINGRIRLDVTGLLKISHAHLRSSIAVTYRSAPSRMRIREFSLDTRLTVWRTLVKNVRLATFLWDKHVCHRNIHSWHILRCNTRLE